MQSVSVLELAMARPFVPIRSLASAAPGAARCEDVPLEIDALRGDLYRLLDQLARAAPGERDGLLEDFDDVWKQFKAAIELHP